MFPTQTSVLANRRCSFRKRKYCGLSSSKMMVMKMRLKHLARLSSMTFKIAAISKIRSELSLKKLIHLITTVKECEYGPRIWPDISFYFSPGPQIKVNYSLGLSYVWTKFSFKIRYFVICLCVSPHIIT